MKRKRVGKRKLPLAHHTQTSREIGFLGRLLGASCERAGNVAGTVVVISMLMLVLLTVYQLGNAAYADEWRQLFVALVTAGLGFLFGRRV